VEGKEYGAWHKIEIDIIHILARRPEKYEISVGN
jgi:predicted cupin superfamily sugar epimerase